MQHYSHKQGCGMPNSSLHGRQSGLKTGGFEDLPSSPLLLALPPLSPLLHYLPFPFPFPFFFPPRSFFLHGGPVLCPRKNFQPFRGLLASFSRFWIVLTKTPYSRIIATVLAENYRPVKTRASHLVTIINSSPNLVFHFQWSENKDL